MANQETFQKKYGPWALVAGASAGLGAAFARQLARRGVNLVLVARRPAILDELAQSLTAKYAVTVRTVALDLGRNDFLDSLLPQINGLDIGLLIYNATFPSIGRFLDHP